MMSPGGPGSSRGSASPAMFSPTPIMHHPQVQSPQSQPPQGPPSRSGSMDLSSGGGTSNNLMGGSQQGSPSPAMVSRFGGLQSLPGSRSGSVDYSQQPQQQQQQQQPPPPQLQSPQHGQGGATPGISFDGSNASARSSLQGTPTLGNNTVPVANLKNHGTNIAQEGDDMLNFDMGLEMDDEMDEMDMDMGGGSSNNGGGSGGSGEGTTNMTGGTIYGNPQPPSSGSNVNDANSSGVGYDNDQDNQQQQDQFGLGGFELNDDEDDVMSGFLNL